MAGHGTVLYPEESWAPPGIESVIRRYWRLFYKHRWIIVAALAVTIALALVVTLVSRAEYTAKLVLQVSREAPQVLNVQQADDEQAVGSSLEFYQTQYALLQSRSLSEDVVQDLNLANNFAFLAGYDQGKVKAISQLPLDKRLELATTIVNEHTRIEPVRGSSIIDVKYVAPNPILAARIANSIGQNFIESNLARRFEAASYARNFLQTKLDQTRAKLEISERKAVEYAEQAGLINIAGGTSDAPTQTSLVANQLGELSTQLTNARAARVQAEAQLQGDSAGSAAAQSLTSSTVNDLRGQRAALVGELSKLQSDFGPEYPQVVALKSQIAELDRQIDREQARVSSSVAQDLRGRYEQAVKAESELQSKVDQLKRDLLGEQSRSIQYTILQRDVDTNRALYEALLQRFKEVGIAGGVGTNNVSVVDPALAPHHRSSPNLLVNLALGLLAGLLAGALAALVLEQLAESVVLPAEFQGKLNTPLLGSTPATKAAKRLALFNPTSTGTSLTSSDSGEAELGEAYLSVMTSLQYSTAEGAPRTMAITSSRAREGKSTTAMALARGFTATGARVLLIDGDMRNPSLHRSYDLPRDVGLSDLLTGHAELESVIRKTNLPGLSLITAGRIPPNPAELLAGTVLRDSLKAALAGFDHVIIDSPPVLGLADAPLISRAVDGTVFIIEAGKTRASQARFALDRLVAVQARIVGAVLTKLDSKKAGYGREYGYSYRYGAE